MSNTEAITEAPAESETINDVVESPESEVSQETSDQSYAINIGDEEIEVTLDELKNGYLRQRDYTQKTQEVAELKRFNDLYRENPLMVIEELARQNGLTIAQATAQANEMADEFEDPSLQKIQTLEARIAAQEAKAQEAQIVGESKAALAKYNLDLGVEELLVFATENRIDNLDAAAKFLSYEQAQENKARSTAEIVQKKREASVVTGGSSTPQGTMSEDFSGKSFGEIYARIKALKG